MNDPYQALGVTAKATQDEIKQAYRKLAKKFHPDLNPGNKQAESKFKEVNQAYEQVGTADARAKFDRGETEEQMRAQQAGQERQYYHQTQGGPGGGRYSQSFGGFDEEMFESIFGGRGRTAEREAPQEIYQMSVDFKDAILGGEKEITLPGGKRLRVKIPAGIESGKKLRFAGQATHSKGDLFIEIQVNPSSVFTRNGDHLETEFSISTAESLLGAEVQVPTLAGSVLMKIPALVSSGQKLRIAGQGVAGKGDLFLKVKIVNPKPNSGAMDEEFKAAVEAWSKRHPFEAREKNTGGAA